MTGSRLRAAVLVVAVAVMGSLSVGCTGGSRAVVRPSGPNDLTFLAGSELKDLVPLFPRIERDTGLRLFPQYTGTLDGAERILNGETTDLAWFSSSKYLTLAAGSGGRVLAQTPIMLSPVVLGVKRSLARAWGWEGNPNITWQNVADKAASGELRYAMTNPAASNSGFSALVGVASAFAGTGRALTTQDIDVQELKRFFSGQALTAGSSGFLSDTYVRQQDQLGGLINYESILLSLNAGGQLHEPLDLIYPREGIITADYPLLLLRSQKRSQYQRLVDELRKPDIQRWIMTHTNRRPVIPQVRPDSRFPSTILVELPFPATLDVINDLLTAYLDEFSHPSDTIFVLDVSGSMEGPRLNSLKSAMAGLTGLDQSLTGRFARFRNREDVTIITFSSSVRGEESFTVDATDQSSPSMVAIRSYVDSLEAGGRTAIYSALSEAYRVAVQSHAQDPSRFVSVVLLTDGENNSGIGEQEFLRGIRGLPGASGIRTFAVLFGEANSAELQDVATATGGKVFDSRSVALAEVFKEIRGYQ